ncbi:hypothetical protein MMC10_006211 [Thelotrema lepadinum]|nr:hypothetical protein [Thelotrema lepadinum]
MEAEQRSVVMVDYGCFEENNGFEPMFRVSKPQPDDHAENPDIRNSLASSMHTKSILDILPQELLDETFYYLAPPDLFCVKLSCRALRMRVRPSFCKIMEDRRPEREEDYTVRCRLLDSYEFWDFESAGYGVRRGQDPVCLKLDEQDDVSFSRRLEDFVIHIVLPRSRPQGSTLFKLYGM